MTSDEEYVRSKWEWFDVLSSHKGIHWRIVMLPGTSLERPSREEAIKAAAAFTREREHQILQIERAIMFLEEDMCKDGTLCVRCQVLAGTLAREQAALANLKRGMK